jgi:hypothetical protein
MFVNGIPMSSGSMKFVTPPCTQSEVSSSRLSFLIVLTMALEARAEEPGEGNSLRLSSLVLMRNGAPGPDFGLPSPFHAASFAG